MLTQAEFIANTKTLEETCPIHDIPLIQLDRVVKIAGEDKPRKPSPFCSECVKEQKDKQEREEIEKHLNASIYQKTYAQLLYQQLEKEKNAELASYKSKEESITADDAAELSLLSSIKLTAAEMQEYLEKYKNKPLALRKLEDIMENDTTLAYIKIDMEKFNQQQRLEKLVHFLNRKIDYFHGGLLINGDSLSKIRYHQADNRY
ncbi:hypothetical protein [Streptococcus dysgalactiae]|uniref:hypothetical protein n=1 Tax=Streptococcus dysgalactiae TaxID=1334 RepID=UPI003EBEEAD6